MGDHIRTRRLHLGLTQREAAEQIGTKEATVESWECSGREPQPKWGPGILAFLDYYPCSTPETLPEKLLYIRRLRGWTKRELAEYLNVDPGSATRWERGGGVRKMRDRRALADLFGEHGLVF